MQLNNTKQRVVDAASAMFYQKGFHGTSVRDIAEKASVNVSLISYYFKGKQGLLEYAVTQYYEGYLETMEAIILANESTKPLEKMKKVIFEIIQYKQRNYQFSCFIHRELSLDSIFVREMSVTYLAKENHFLYQLFSDVTKQKGNQKMNREFLYMQLKGMLVTPYLLQHEWKNYTVGKYSHDKFVENYVQTIHLWLDLIGQNEAVNQE